MTGDLRNKVLVWNKNKLDYNNGSLPSSLRCLIIGPSGSGKTQLLLKMLVYKLDFERLVICSPSLQAQDEYKIILKAFTKGLDQSEIAAIFDYQDEIEENEVDSLIDDIASDKSKKDKIIIETYKSPDDLPSPEVLKQKEPKKKTLIIIDDCMMKKQNTISEYFVYSRPLQMNVIYLTQSFFKTDKQGTRDNANLFIFFKINKLDLRNVFTHLPNKNMTSLDDLKKFAQESWDEIKDDKQKSRGYFLVDRDKETFEANSIF